MIFIFKTVPTRYEKQMEGTVLSVTESAAMIFCCIKDCDIDMVKNFADRIAMNGRQY